MKCSTFTESQIIFAPCQVETSDKVDEVGRKMGILEATFYDWKKKYGGLGVTELCRLRQLEEEYQQLKQIVADLSLYNQMLQDIIKNSFMSTPEKELAI